jgi:enamine deaminase RidA (YjgF/YER057c/UK114 family)
MAHIEAKLQTLGLVLPAPLVLPPGVALPFPWVRIHGNRAYVSGHAAQNADGSLARPLGKVGLDLTPDEAKRAARLTALSILASLKRELGDLDRISAWLRVFGMVNCAPGFSETPAVINGFTELIVELYGATRGLHARSAVGMAELPFGIPVEIEAEVAIDTPPDVA